VLTVDEAALRLGVSDQEVRRLIRAGTLPSRRVGRTLVIADDAVDSRARLGITRGRSVSARTSWAMLWELSGERADWLDRVGRSRLRSRLQRSTTVQLVAAARSRSDKHQLRVQPFYRDRVLQVDGVVLSGMSAANAVGADIVAVEAADEIYCSTSTLTGLHRDFGLSGRGEANLIVRVPRFDGLPLTDRERMPAAVIAVDLAESGDVRTRRAGLTLLEAAARAARV
jgi:excisionase family DNA binding protein